MTGDAAGSAPCRHVGSPPTAVVERAALAIKALASYPAVLAEYGITPGEFDAAFPAAVESLRGSMSASNFDRREFLLKVLSHLVERELVSSVTQPAYGQDTVYRLNVPNLGAVAIIQKGCPDGAHSSTRWVAPEWAAETYLWWLCPSLAAHAGEHVAKGVNRLRKKFFTDEANTLSGVIFHNDLCGTQHRPCPKQAKSAVIGGARVPAPCIYTMPGRTGGTSSWNWDGGRKLHFPPLLLQAFDVDESEAGLYTGFIGFQRKDNGALRTTITTRFGAGRSSTFRS